MSTDIRPGDITIEAIDQRTGFKCSLDFEELVQKVGATIMDQTQPLWTHVWWGNQPAPTPPVDPAEMDAWWEAVRQIVLGWFGIVDQPWNALRERSR